MTSSAPAISVIIVNYNSGPRLKRCLEYLRAQSFRDFETLVVDNASTDDSIAQAREGDFQLIEAGDNIGFAAANNLAAKSAKGALLVFLNPDAYAAPDWLEALMRATTTYPGVDAFGSTQVDHKDHDRIDGAGDVYHAFGLAYRGGFGSPVSALPPEGECFAPCAAASMVRREAFAALGGFYEPFFCYSEDVDLGFRLRLSGGRCVQLLSAVVYHEGSGVTGRRSDFTVYHGHRNRIWTWYLNMPLTLLIATAPFHLLLDLVLFAQSSSRGDGGAYIRGLRDGYGGLARLSAERRRRQQARKASTGEIAQALTWSPLKLMRRATDIRPVQGP
ncbi:glycosyltransferase family 2 protein [Hyphococcus sp.]|uniref:glycosyltransferase family 2 protein n=1 Tax=Hyphococcus sp. TaxID=2038636 RepID=UPI0035C774B2